MEITTTLRLRLRTLEHADDAFIMELVNDPLWLRFIGDRKVHSLPAARAYIDKVRDGYAQHGFGLWAVERLADGAVAGLCGLLKRDSLELPDVGFAFLPAFRGQGLAGEAMAATLELARTRYALARVLAITDIDNVASQGVLLRAGFAFTRTQRADDDGVLLNVYECELGASVPPAREGR
ncbi:MAG: GNAT family N-acetyltransferase [Candidatus Eisenbacteria bacterium]